MDWRESALCTPADARLFDPLDESDRCSGDGGAGRIRKAVTLCNSCRVRTECLHDALDARDAGVRGGVYVEGGKIRAIVTDRLDGRESILGEVLG